MTVTLLIQGIVRMTVHGQLMDIIAQQEQELHHQYAHNFVGTASKHFQKHAMMDQMTVRDAR